MDVEYLLGSKKDFYDFVNLITHQDRVGVVTHKDVDGLASAVFLEKILEEQNLPINFLEFVDIKKDFLEELSVKLEEANITKLFICDLAVDDLDVEGLEGLRRILDVFVIDHHPINEALQDKRNILKTSSNDCTALTVFDLGEDVLDESEWAWLVCAAIFSEFSYKKISHWEYLKKIYPQISKDNLSSSVPGMNSRRINAAIVYYSANLLHVYELVKARKMDELSEIESIIDEEIDRIVEDFAFKAEHFSEKSIHFYEFQSKFDLVSSISTLISKMRPSDTFVLMQKIPGGKVKISARNQEKVRDMGLLISACVKGLEDASGGGHPSAAGALIRAEDVSEFKRRLIEGA